MPTMVLSQNTNESLEYKCYKYGNHDRQRVGVWKRPATQTEGCWIMYATIGNCSHLAITDDFKDTYTEALGATREMG